MAGAETFATDLIAALAAAGPEQAVVTRPFLERLARLVVANLTAPVDADRPDGGEAGCAH